MEKGTMSLGWRGNVLGSPWRSRRRFIERGKSRMKRKTTTNQHRVRISSSANHRPRLHFKYLHSRTNSLFQLSCDPPPPHLHHLAS
ncbi:hypothetical protein AMECASPLE_028694 [Ameca splendens]|uniref:Uncharacterized protein n=1 Tax=Ameca splendens TaxID=208324 RepID=A0ABV1A2D0_9TELE